MEQRKALRNKGTNKGAKEETKAPTNKQGRNKETKE